MKGLSNILRLRDAQPGDLPYARTTIYKLHSLRQYPALIYRVPGMGLVIDLDELERMRRKAQGDSIEEATRIHRPLAAL